MRIKSQKTVSRPSKYVDGSGESKWQGNVRDFAREFWAVRGKVTVPEMDAIEQPESTSTHAN